MALSGNYDATLKVGLEADTSPLFRQISNLSTKLPPLRLKTQGFSALGTISRDAQEFQKSLSSANARVLAFGASAGTLFAVARGFREVVKSTIEVEQQLKDINVILGLSTQSLGKFSNQLFDVANKTGQSFKIASQAALEFSRQGLSVEQTLKRTQDALTLTRLSGLDVAKSVETITAALNGFNDVTLDSTQLINKLATVDAAFAVSTADLAEGFQRVGSTAADTGVKLDSLIGLITSAQQSTARGGAVIGNALKTIFQRIQRPEVIDTLKQFNIQVENSQGVVLSADRILQNLAKTYENADASQKNFIVGLAAGVFQSNQFRAILKDLAKENSIYSRAVDISTNATDAAAQRQAELNKTLSASINETINKLTQAASSAGNIVIKPVAQRVLGITNLFADSLQVGTEGEGLGGNIGKGILQGLGNYLSGPGLGVGIVLLGKLFFRFADFAKTAFTQLLEVTGREAAQRQAIDGLLAKIPGLQEQIIKGALTQEQIQARIVGYLQQETLIRAQLGEVSGAVSSGLTSGQLKIINSNVRLGNVPNFADPVYSALSREKSAGIPPSLIKIGQSSQLKSTQNPLGLGVYNLRDEPSGLQQGINRALTEGKNPKNYGIPNFAPNPNFSNLTTTQAISVTQRTQLAAKLNELALLANSGVFQSIESSNFRIKLGKIVDSFKLTGGAVKKIETEMNEIIRNFQFFNKIPVFKQSSLAPNRLVATPLPPNFAENLITDDLRKEFKRIFDRPAYSTTLKSIVSPKFPGRLSTNQEILESLTASKVPEYQRVLFANKVDPLYNIKQKQKEFQQKLDIERNKELEDLKIQSIQRQKEIEFSSRVSNLQNVSLLSPIKATKNVRELQKLSPDAARELRNSLSNQAFLASIIVPTIAGIFQNGIATIGGNSRTSRGLGQSVSGLGNILSGGLTGFALTGGNPIGAGFGAGIAALFEIPQAIKAFTDTLPDLEKRLGDLQDTSQKTSAALDEFITSSEKLADISSGQVTGVTKGQIQQLQQGQRNALLSIPNLQDRNNIEALVKSGNLTEARTQIGLINQRNTQAENSNKLLQSVELLLPNIQSEQQLRAKAQSVFSFSESEGFLPESIRNRNEKIKEDLVQRALNDPKRLKQLDSLLAPIQQSALGLTNKKGESIFDILLNNPNLSQQLSGSKSGDLGKNFADLALSLDDFDPEAIANISQSFNNLEQSLGPEAGKRFRQGFDINELKRIKELSEDFIASTVRNTNAIYTLNKALFESRRKFEDLGISIELSANKRLNDLSTKLKGSEIRQSTANQITLLTKGSVLRPREAGELSNLLEFRQTQLANRGKNIEALGQLNSNIRNQTFGALTNFNVDVTEAIKNELEKLFKDNKGEIKSRIDVFQKGFQGNFGVFERLLQSGGQIQPVFFDRLLEKISQQIGQAEKFNNLGGIPSELGSLETKLKEGKIGPIEFAGLKNQVITSGQRRLGLSNQEVDLLNKLSPDELQTQATQAPVLIEQYKKIGDEIRNVQKSYKIGTQDINNELEKQNEIAKIQLEQSNKLLRIQTQLGSVFSKDRLNIEKQINENSSKLGGITGDFSGVKGNLGNTFLSGFDFGRPDFFRQLAEDTANFGDDFKNAIKGGFKEGIAGARDLEDAFRQVGLSISQNILGKLSDLAVDQLFGLASSGARTLFKTPQKGAIGGIIKKYATGGYVNMGSGTRDDVPALLSGGEFVLNKRATRAIGVKTLDRINYQSNSSFDSLFANEYFGIGNQKKPKKGTLNVSPFLSDLALTDDNNPQNRLRLSREKYFFDLRQYQKQIAKARAQFESQRKTSIYISTASALLNAGLTYSTSPNNLSPQQSAAFKQGSGPVDQNGATTFLNNNSNNSNPYGFSLYSNYASTLGRFSGGIIPKKYAYGGKVFGADTSTDSIPAFLMGGEYVINNKSAQKIGVDHLNYMNKNGKIPRFADGGYVGNNGYRPNNSSSTISSPVINITNSINVTLNSNGGVQTQTNSKISNDKNKQTNNTEDQEQGKKIGELVNSIVNEALIKQSKNGGFLESTFKKK